MSDTAERRSKRLFFALWPDDDVRMALERATRKLVRRSGGRPTRVGNLHITLAFLGQIESSRVADVLAVGERVRGAPFSLELNRVQIWGRSGVLCLLPSAPPEEVMALERALRNELQAARFEIDPRPYRPHLTVARKVSRPPRNLSLDGSVDWFNERFALVESVTERQGARYEVLESWTLGPAG